MKAISQKGTVEMSERYDELLLGMANDLLHGRTPLNDEFLEQNNVTLEECMDLSRTAGRILRGVLVMPGIMQSAIRIIPEMYEVNKTSAMLIFNSAKKEFVKEKWENVMGKLDDINRTNP
jgi:hypothetical protein